MAAIRLNSTLIITCEHCSYKLRLVKEILLLLYCVGLYAYMHSISQTLNAYKQLMYNVYIYTYVYIIMYNCVYIYLLYKYIYIYLLYYIYIIMWEVNACVYSDWYTRSTGQMVVRIAAKAEEVEREAG